MLTLNIQKCGITDPVLAKVRLTKYDIFTTNKAVHLSRVKVDYCLQSLEYYSE